MEWIKDYTDSNTHPQMIAAGFWGRIVFRELCRLSGKHNLSGRLVPEYLEPEFLAGQIGIPWDISIDEYPGNEGPIEICRRAIARCVEVGLLRKPAGNTRVFLIDGWDRRQPSSSQEAEKKRRLRERRPESVPQMSPEVEVEVEVEVEKQDQKPLSAAADLFPDVRVSKGWLQAIWNHWAPQVGLPKWEGMNKGREAKELSRWLEKPREDYWHEVCRRIAASHFARGKNDRGWRATPDWLLQPDTHLKVMEGKYDNRAPAQVAQGFSNHHPEHETVSDERLAQLLEEGRKGHAALDAAFEEQEKKKRAPND